ncbi:acidic leucine-rich nuclear phosphoprotein 32-related protein [Manihot esculenta]|uniref:U2A'/phosphoprotein 32 family A C-terminal domain-containing protein n=1 Tax=Manihot esculenta TaxID=3983 RepID=A0A2C9WN39_MANES|nr:acidic leucine-rich nuclear phosphoprotein 32-related protein [Manihot esculenta]OAY60720.1 hypothetical protein MANES_01G133900v8 [Manihot esculenta]
MDEIWERAVETALDGQTDHAAARTLTLDGVVKCVHGRLPPPSLLEKFENLLQLSIANIGVSSLDQFPRLRNLQKLILSDNRISGGLEFLVDAGLDSLRDLDLSNNRIQYIEDLAPLAQLKLISLDLYECPVTRVKDYRSRVFGLIKSLKYLDKMDPEGNERPESDEEDEEEDDEDDPGSGEIDGEERPYRLNNGHSEGVEGIVDVDEDEESDADEEETETARRINGPNQNGFRVAAVGGRDDVEEGDEEEENESGEEIDYEDGDDDDDDDDVVEVHEIEDSGDEEDGVEDDDEDEEDEEEDEEEEEEVDNDEVDFAEPESTGRLASTEGEIDGHEQGEDDGEEDDNGETGEEEQGVDDDGEFEEEEDEEDYGAGYLVQPVGQAEVHDAGGSDMEANEEDDHEGEEEVEDDEVQVLPSSSSSHNKRKKDEDLDLDEDDDFVEYSKSSKKKR